MKKIALLLFPLLLVSCGQEKQDKPARAGIYYECDVFQYKV